ncbi:MAG: cyclic pyranopterin monophosphate synthase MoaC [Pseudomonadota bacterium]|nr:cyclic pyranopterin monophosphate synthase MoaC [Pseudomonadota bacterium]
MSKLSHFNRHGEARMVDIAAKTVTHRIAIAEGTLAMNRETLTMVQQGLHKKGDVLGIARIAGIMAAKKTADLIPLCHPLPLTHIEISFFLDAKAGAARCEAKVETSARTGVEMEALTAVQVALLTVYDMCKSVDRGMTISGVRLLEKLGGKSGHWRR